MADNFSVFNKKVDLRQFLDQDVDLGKYFSKKELEEMNPHQQKRYKNIAQNYEVMLHMGLPAVKPDFMKGPAFRARKAKMHEKAYAEAASDSNSDDEEWTPDMEARKKRKAMKFMPPKPKYQEVWKKPATSTSSSATPVKKRKSATVTKDTSEKPEKKVYNFREHTQVTSFMNLEPPDDDQFLYCEECNKEYDMDCPVHGPLTYVMDTPVTEDDPDRALHTLPEDFIVKESSIPGAGLGVFAEKLIPARTKFGPYGGVKITNQDLAHSSGYCWQIYKDGSPSHFVDAADKKHSNWMRYVNCAITEAEQNLVAFQHLEEIYYRTFKPVLAGKELLVYYGDEYARDLGAYRDENAFLRPKYVMGTVCYPCIFCGSTFSAAGLCVLHVLRLHGGRKLTARDVCILDEWLKRNKCGRYKDKDGGIDAYGKENVSTEIFSRSQNSDGHNIIDVEQISNKIGFTKKHTLSTNIRKKYCRLDGSDVCLQKGTSVRYMKTCTGEKPYKCDVCQYASSLKGDLVTHMRTHTGEKPYKCDVCQYASNQKGPLVRHMRTHTGEKPYKCDVCQYASSVKSHLVTHMRTHTGEKPYKCDVCQYASSLKGDLVTHMRTHTGEKPYKCDVCEYASSQKGHLVTHMRTHTGEKPYKCDVCEYASSEKDHLVRHMRTHTGEKPYKCDVCQYASSVKGDLVTHMRTHTGEKPYKCDVCQCASSKKGDLVRHMRTHTGEKPYKCDVCQYASNQKSNLVTHMRTHTGDKAT